MNKEVQGKKIDIKLVRVKAQREEWKDGKRKLSGLLLVFNFK